jgi:hypothetical protein
MKKIITMISVLIISISISACSSKTSNTIKSEETPPLSTTNVKESITNTYEQLDKLPQKYNSELALKNGDVVNGKIKSYNIEKLDRFIETYKNKKADVAEMVRITSYTTEGDAIISDLIIDSEGTKLIEDSTRDKFSNTENRKKTEYKIVDIRKINKVEGIFYMAVTDKGEERFLFFQRNIIDGKLDIICNNPKVIASSNPYDYTKDSQDYKDIVNLGDNALKYMLTKFEDSKENGLREYVMAIACSEILRENTETKNWDTGRGWYDNYTKTNSSRKANSEILLEKSDRGNLPNTIENSEMKLEIYLENNNLSSSTNEISLKVKNTGLMDVSFGQYYYIESFKGNSWNKVPFKENIGFNAILYNLKPGTTGKYQIYLKNLRYNLPSGKYRVIKEFTSNKNTVFLSVEFNIS